MKPIEGLQQLGLTEYEAKTYVALLQTPGLTGYEASRQSGVPRSKIYETLDALVSKSAAYRTEDGSRTLYYPTEHATLLERHLDGVKRLTTKLRPALGALAQGSVQAPVVILNSDERIFGQTRELLNASRKTLFLSGDPKAIQQLSAELGEAAARGVDIYTLTCGEVALPVTQVYYHDSGLMGLLLVVSDQSAALIAQLAHMVSGIYSQNVAVARVTAEFIKHDIYLNELHRRYEVPVLQDLQKMWGE